MTNQVTPHTSPEAVERLANRLGGTPLYDGSGEESDLPDNAAATLRALSDALEAKKATVKTLHDLDEISVETVQQLTAERDALKAELAEALGVIRHGYDLIKGDAVGSDWKHGCHDFTKDARAIIARHQKGADT